MKTNKQITKQFQNSLKIAIVEKDIENAYRNALSLYFPSQINSPFHTDGVIFSKDVNSLLEFKDFKNLKDKKDQCDILIQSLFYIKKFELEGKKIPTSIFIGNRKNCFCILTNSLSKYLTIQIDWNVPPSGAAKKYPNIILEMIKDSNIIPFIFNIDYKSFDFYDVILQLKAIHDGKFYQTRILKSNIINIFEKFITDVVIDKTVMFLNQKEKRQKIIEDVNTFFNCLTDKENTFLHPKKLNILVSKGKEIKINQNEFKMFFAQFSQILTPSELDVLTANKDTIIENFYRRKYGEFFTPIKWAEEAHKIVSKELGENWKEEYIVWDCCSGTNNLTKNFQFKELYCSTLEQGDIDTVKDMKYNPEAIIFQYDFLNDDEINIFGNKIPLSLKSAFESGKKILFFINPPYKDTGNGFATKSANKIEKNIVQKSSKIHELSQQFLYKIVKLSEKYQNVNLLLFSKLSLLIAPSVKNLRLNLQNQMKYVDGFAFDVKDFEGTSAGGWGILCSLWEKINQTEEKIVKNFNVKIMDKPGNIIKNKIYKNTDNIIHTPIKNWLKTNDFETKQELIFSNSKLEIKNHGFVHSGSIGYLIGLSTNVNDAFDKNCLFSCPTSLTGYISINEDNFYNCTSFFSACKLIIPSFLNKFMYYQIPNINHPEYDQWVKDCIIYSLFHIQSQQSSLRNIKINNTSHNIQNEFFFMSNQEIKNLADTYNFIELYQDCKTFSEDRFIFKLLNNIQLSDDARDVLNMFKNLIETSIEYRKIVHSQHPEYHLHAWDAGWKQIKFVLKQFMKSDLKLFREKYRLLQSRLRNGVYKFGFLEE